MPTVEDGFYSISNSKYVSMGDCSIEANGIECPLFDTTLPTIEAQVLCQRKDMLKEGIAPGESAAQHFFICLLLFAHSRMYPASFSSLNATWQASENVL